jgi:hypothetical protein
MKVIALTLLSTKKPWAVIADTRERERFISPKGRVWMALRAIPGR